jgi:hypothetical protein
LNLEVCRVILLSLADKDAPYHRTTVCSVGAKDSDAEGALILICKNCASQTVNHRTVVMFFADELDELSDVTTIASR